MLDRVVSEYPRVVFGYGWRNSLAQPVKLPIKPPVKIVV